MVGKIYKNRKYNIPKETINSLKDFFLTSSLANRFAIILNLGFYAFLNAFIYVTISEVLSWGWFCLRGHLVMPGNVFRCQNWEVVILSFAWLRLRSC